MAGTVLNRNHKGRIHDLTFYIFLITRTLVLLLSLNGLRHAWTTVVAGFLWSSFQGEGITLPTYPPTSPPFPFIEGLAGGCVFLRTPSWLSILNSGLCLSTWLPFETTQCWFVLQATDFALISAQLVAIFFNCGPEWATGNNHPTDSMFHLRNTAN
jgi:hypothetical protein